MKIAIDIMGGDFAPTEIVQGALEAAAAWPQHNFILVGRKDAMPAQLPANCSLHEADQVMGMDESVENLRQKKESSIWQATLLVKEGRADALVSAGSTAAQMAAAVLLLGRVKGVSRPAIGSVIPGLKEERVALDIGANTECTPAMMLQFAHMGKIFAEVLLKRDNPRICLLSNGSESHKGNELIREAHTLLAESSLNFIGNMEGRDIFSGDFDVMVFDGFSGNIAIKSAEGAFTAIMSLLKTELMSSLRGKTGALLITPNLRRIKKHLDYQEFGGAPLLGINGISIVCHGSSKARAIVNAVGQAVLAVEAGFISRIAEALALDKP
ncbi:MAG: phosphate acyltransferase PlsX [Clostridiales bacterium]|nr:phosphate acyltransferase PlsX [Clostridiales bacterium]